MFRSNPSLIALSLLFCMAPVVAQAAELPCLTAAEMTAVVSYAAPSAITAISQRCAASLPSDAFLKTGGSAMVAKYSATRTAAWPLAKATILRLAGAMNPEVANMMKILPDDAIRPTIDTLLQSKLSDSFPLEKCGMSDQMFRLLAPLPPENVAALLPLALALGTGHIGKLSLCPAKAPAPSPAPAVSIKP